MDNYLESYNNIDSDQLRKEAAYKFIDENKDKVKMTPEEEYLFNWGAQSLSSDWIDGKARDIRNSIMDSNSTSILRRGLSKGESIKPVEEKPGDTPADTETEGGETDRFKQDVSNIENGTTIPGSGKGNLGGTGSPGVGTDGTSTNAGMAGFSSLSMTTQEGLSQAAKEGAAGLASAGLLGGIIGAVKGYFNGSSAQTARENASVTTREENARASALSREETDQADQTRLDRSYNAITNGETVNEGTGPFGTGVAGGLGDSPSERKTAATLATRDVNYLGSPGETNGGGFGNGNGATGHGYSGAGIGGNVGPGSSGSSHFG